ncbi:MAG: preprotein translocase subunit YajC [Planctomycetota bacterium]|nr:preprotein translocase subunit YajC [Planctomycetota bacterium]
MSLPTAFMPILAAAEAREQGGQWIIWAPLVLMVVFYYVLLIRPQQKERGKRQELLNSLKKNDRVVTTSGMVGTVANISQDGKEITLKFGDTTRIPFLRSAIETVLRDESAPAETAAKT